MSRQRKRHRWDVNVFKKGSEVKGQEVDTVLVVSFTRLKAARIGLLFAADYLNCMTSKLVAVADELPEGTVISHDKYDYLACAEIEQKAAEQPAAPAQPESAQPTATA